MRIVAALARVHHVEWASGQARLVPGDSLVEQQTVGLKSGLIELNMVDGATLMLEGPLSLRFDSTCDSACAPYARKPADSARIISYPLLRRPAARPLIVRWIARCVRTPVSPAR